MIKKDAEKGGEIIIYKTSKNEVGLKLRLEEKNIWLTQKQMGDIFRVNVRTVNEHLVNIFKTEELSKSAVIRKIRITAKDDKKYLTNVYSLDAILSVGYRVNSKQATQFRIWATKILRQYLLDGYTINQKRLLETNKKFAELQKAVALLRQKSQKEQLKGQESEIFGLLADYSKTLTILEQYDSGKLKSPKGRKARFILKYEKVQDIVVELKKELITKKEAVDLFGNERGGEFEGIIKTIYQTFGGKELYYSLEEKAAHILYFIIKDHPLFDGNKRTASFLFVFFLDKNNYLYRKNGERKINDNALVSLALLIAESDPKEKETLIKIIVNLII